MVEASATGLFRTLLIIIGAIVVLRFIGQVMTAKRNLSEENKIREREDRLRKEKEYKKKTLGKTRVLKSKIDDAEDVDFEEM